MNSALLCFYQSSPSDIVLKTIFNISGSRGLKSSMEPALRPKVSFLLPHHHHLPQNLHHLPHHHHRSHHHHYLLHHHHLPHNHICPHKHIFPTITNNLPTTTTSQVDCCRSLILYLLTTETRKRQRAALFPRKITTKVWKS